MAGCGEDRKRKVRKGVSSAWQCGVLHLERMLRRSGEDIDASAQSYSVSDVYIFESINKICIISCILFSIQYAVYHFILANLFFVLGGEK